AWSLSSVLRVARELRAVNRRRIVRYRDPTPENCWPTQCAVLAYGLPPSAFEMSAIAFCARTLLPAASSGGETTAMPNFPGETAMRPPPTPLLPGRPVR